MPWGRWERLTVIGALALDGVVASMSVAAATVARSANEALVLAELELALTTLDAFVAMAAEPADADALPELPDRRGVLADGDDAAHHLMAGHAGRLKGRTGPLDVGGVRAAKAAGLDLDQDLAGSGLRRLALDQLQRAGRRDLHGAICGPHGSVPLPPGFFGGSGDGPFPGLGQPAHDVRDGALGRLDGAG